MQADAGGATRVYVHGHVKWRTVPKRAARPSARALSCRARMQSTPRGVQYITRRSSRYVLDVLGHANPCAHASFVDRSGRRGKRRVSTRSGHANPATESSGA
jgi:hypothetical protein